MFYFYYRMIRRSGFLYAFLMRLQYYEDETLTSVQEFVNVQGLFLTFYKEYEAGFNQKSKGTTYNTHCFSHCLEQRKGPCHLSSAEPFESAYYSMKQAFVAGTRNVTKQLLLKYLMRDKVRHACHLKPVPLLVTAKENEKTSRGEDNTIVSIREEDGSIGFVRVHAKWPNKTFRVARLTLAPFQGTSSIDLDLPWGLIGVFKITGEESNLFSINSGRVRGKGVIVQDTICEMLPQWMQSRLKA
jgi:hypothetical protein